MKNKTKFIVIITLALAGGWLGWQFAGKNSAPTQYFYNFSSPSRYDQTLSINAFNYTFSIQPLEALAASKNEAGNVVKYIDAYTNTDVVQTRYADKLKEDIILKSAGHPDKFAYQIDIDNYDFAKEKDGAIVFYER